MTISLPIFKKSFQLGFGSFKISKWLSVDERSRDQDNSVYYQTSIRHVRAKMLTGFFEGWPNPPDQTTHIRILNGSSHVVLALAPSRDKVIGFVTAISDRVTCAYIPLLEVLPEHRGQGIGTELVRRMLEMLEGIYAIDLLCEDDVVPFYERLGMQRANGMFIRNYENQSGLPTNRHEWHW